MVGEHTTRPIGRIEWHGLPGHCQYLEARRDRVYQLNVFDRAEATVCERHRVGERLVHRTRAQVHGLGERKVRVTRELTICRRCRVGHGQSRRRVDADRDEWVVAERVAVCRRVENQVFPVWSLAG